MSLHRTLVLLGLLTAPACTHSPSAYRADAAMSATDRELAGVVERQLAAYNAHDVAAFADTYAADTRIYNFPDQPYLTGRESVRAAYTQFFAGAPSVHATVPRRIVQGRLVIDEEVVTGISGADTVRAVVIYEVTQGKISRAWIAR